MSRWRWVTGFGVVAALAGVLIFLSLQRGGSPVVTPSSTSTPMVTSTTQAVVVTTTAPSESTSTITEEQRRAEVEALLKELWFGWFEAIYRKDPDALWQVVATTRNYDAGVAAMETMEFRTEPDPDSVVFMDLEVLLDRPDCLVAHYVIDASAIVDDEPSPFVSVMWPDPRYGFRLATDWLYTNDLWLNDCDNLEREQTP